ncbi:hypothetical protein BpHYR1_003242 [Brachionus plicatilis]|uniref:Uncharacterized protein n=1 Tax=Brachionus plicatilis TaxID=10195 RepID=A0A3M7T9M4_BRAPC|nr:hypothetical protein BpHYR1_003242 [Brachionus plicatilis]
MVVLEKVRLVVESSAALAELAQEMELFALILNFGSIVIVVVSESPDLKNLSSKQCFHFSRFADSQNEIKQTRVLYLGLRDSQILLIFFLLNLKMKRILGNKYVFSKENRNNPRISYSQLAPDFDCSSKVSVTKHLLLSVRDRQKRHDFNWKKKTNLTKNQKYI